MHHNGKALSLVIKNARIWSPSPYRFQGKKVIGNGTGYRSDNNNQAVGIIDDKIVYVGDNSIISSMISSSTTIVDACGGLLIPGFTDAHCHFLGA